MGRTLIERTDGRDESCIGVGRWVGRRWAADWCEVNGVGRTGSERWV